MHIGNQVERGILSIPMKYGEQDWVSGSTEGLPISNMLKYVEIIGKKSFSLSAGQIISKHFQDNVSVAQDVMELGSARHDETKTVYQISFKPGAGGAGVSNVGVGLIGFAVDPSDSSKVVAAHAIYVERWTEEDGVHCNQNHPVWAEANIRQFLLYKMLNVGLPSSVSSRLKWD